MAKQWWMGGFAMLAMAGSHAAAQETPSAVGRISYSETVAPGDAICTAVLVAPDLVLTARHCLPEPDAAQGIVYFSIAPHSAKTKGVKVIFSSEKVAQNHTNDVALLQLNASVPSDIAVPLALADRALAHILPRFSVVAYRRDAQEQAGRQDDCTIVSTLPGIFGLSCPAVSGNSGAPLLGWDGTDWRIIAVMVAAARGDPVQSLAAQLPQNLAAHIAMHRLP